MSATLQIGDRVTKPEGYRFDAWIVAVFDTLAGKRRVVADNGDGLLHIFAPEQLRMANSDRQS